MKPKSTLRHFLLLASSSLLATPALQAGTIVPPANRVSGDVPLGTLLAIDTPYQAAIPVSGPIGPDWPEDTDDGWVMKSGSNLEADHGQLPWEPDGTLLAQARTYRLNSAPGLVGAVPRP